MRTLQAITAGELETLRNVCVQPCNLSNFERLAILRGIEIELGDREAAVKSGFACASEVERLQVLLEEQEDQIVFLQMQVDELEQELKEQKAANGKAKLPKT